MSAVAEVKKLIQERDLSKVAARFRESGMDEHVQSWISKGKNLPVAGDQIERALGSDVVARIGAKLGITQVEAADEIADVMPEVVDDLTPEGELPPEQAS